MLDPIASRTGLNFSKTSFLPPTIKLKVPSIALGSPPLTGASSISIPYFASPSEISRLAIGLIEDMSINVAPFSICSATLSSSSITLLTWGEFGSIVKTSSAPLAVSTAFAAATAFPLPNSTTSST